MKPFLFFFFQMACLMLLAQTNPDPVLNIQENLLGNGNEAYIQQVGSDNDAYIDQLQRGDQRINLATVIQNGDFNEVDLVQRGKGNQTIVMQNGNNNIYDLLLTGRDNNVVIQQNGDGNSIVQRLRGFQDVDVEFIQEGNDNSIIQDLKNVSEQEFKIRQVGNGLSLKITVDNY